MTDRWESSLPASDVLAYYHEQMAARGWRDVTEETYSLQPEMREGLSGDEDERYAERYRDVMESTLVMSSGLWTMHVHTGPSKRGPRYVAVEIYGAAAPSIAEFSRSLESTFASSPGQPNRPLEAVQRDGGQVYRTTMATTDRRPEDAFHRELTALQQQGWRPLLILPNQHALAGHFAWLAKGESYTTLSVSPQKERGRCSVATTQVTPEKTATGSLR